jgi:hypothetical protein
VTWPGEAGGVVQVQAARVSDKMMKNRGNRLLYIIFSGTTIS